jgi:hypothetical protein
VKSKWINVPDLDKSPLLEYFINRKLDMWLKYCEILSDAHDRVSQMVVNGYLPDFKKIAIERLAGELVFKALENTKFLLDLKVQKDLTNFIVKAASMNPVSILIVHFLHLLSSLSSFIILDFIFF